MDFKKIKNKEHFLYDNINEFNVYHPETPVRHSSRDGEEGEWVFTDDGYICQVLRKLNISNRTSKRVLCARTVCGTFLCKDRKKEMLGVEGIAENIYTFSGNNKYTKTYNERKRNPKELLFARYVATGMDAVDAYKLVFPDSKSNKYVKRRTDGLLKTEKVQKMISKERRKMLEDEGITDNWIIERYKTLVDLAENDTHRLKSLDSLAKMSGLFDTEEKKSEQVTIWAGFSPEQLEEVKKHGKPELIAHAKKDEEEETT